MNVFETLTNEQTKGVIIHHWDTDGIVSAALLLTYMHEHYPEKKVELFVPTITNYYLTEQQFAYFKQQGYQFALTCDINFPEETVNSLAETFPNQTYMFDHHHQTPYTNVHYFNEPHPACASYINDLLGFPNTVQSVIAIVGDKEEAIQQDTTYFPRVQEVMAEHGLTFMQLLEARQLIDSNYIVDDYAGMADTVQLVKDDPLAILTDVRLRDNVSTINETLSHITEQEPTKVSDHVYYFEIDSPFNILSHATRALSRQYPDKIIFTRHYKNDQYTCYVRRRDVAYDMTNMIAYARSLGLNSGGKEDVVGIIIPKELLAEIFPKIEAQLKSITL